MVNIYSKQKKVKGPFNKTLLTKTFIKLTAIAILLTVLVASFPINISDKLSSSLNFGKINFSNNFIASKQTQDNKVNPNLVNFEISSTLKGLEPDKSPVSREISQDNRVSILKEYLTKYNSPLVPHAQDFVEAADTYSLDWKLVAAISGVESTFGRFIPGGHNSTTTSYNGWGWGVYGSNVLKFSSWKDGIFTVSKGLKERYVDKGLITPYQMNKVYAASPTWGSKVDYFLKDIDKFANQYSTSKSLAYNSSTGLNTLQSTSVKQSLLPDSTVKLP